MIFLRHPVTAAPPDLCYGQLDIGLGEGAAAQIEAALAAIPRVPAIRSSDLTRARTLADRFAARDGVPVTADPRLREYHFGDWEGRLWSEIHRPDSEAWLEDLWANAPPGGESFATLHARTAAALADCAPGTLIVCHAGVIRAAKMILGGQGFDEVVAAPVPFCEPIEIAREAA